MNRSGCPIEGKVIRFINRRCQNGPATVGKQMKAFFRGMREVGRGQGGLVPVGAVSDRRLHWEHKRCLSRCIRLYADESQRMKIALRFHRPLLVPQQAPTIELDVLYVQKGKEAIWRTKVITVGEARAQNPRGLMDNIVSLVKCGGCGRNDATA